MSIEEGLSHVLGLSKNAAKIYSALLSNGEMDVKQLQQTCHIPLSRIYEILKNMELDGLIEHQKRGNLPKSYRVIHPRQVIESLIEKEQVRSAQKIEKMSELGTILSKKWQNTLSSSQTGDLMITTFEVGEENFLEDIRQVNERVLIAAASRKTVIDWSKSGKLLGDIFRKKVEVKYLVKTEHVAQNLRKKLDLFFSGDIKFNINFNANLEVPFVILDNILYIILSGETATLDSVIIRSTNIWLVKQFDWLFEQLWNSSG